VCAEATSRYAVLKAQQRRQQQEEAAEQQMVGVGGFCDGKHGKHIINPFSQPRRTSWCRV
jgi:hypothetical protein